MPEPLRKRLGDKSTSAPRSAAARPASARPATGRPSRPPSGKNPAVKPPTASSKRNVVLFAAIGGSVLLVIVLAVVMSGGSGGKARPAESLEEPTPTKVASPAPKKPAPATPAPPPKEPDDPFARAKEDARKFAEEQKKKNAELEKKATEERAREEAEKKKEKEEADAKSREAFAAYDLRKRQRREDSAKRLEESKKAVEQDHKAEIARQKALVEKLKNQKLGLKLKNNMQLQNVVVQGMTRDELKLAFTYDGSPVEQAFPIEFVEDKSYAELLKSIYTGDGAAGFYEMGRHLVLRKQWKDAEAAFAECVKADATYGPRVPDLSRILHNEAAFKGASRRIGSNQLYISYDFSDAAQAQDFLVHQAGKLSIEGGELRMQSPATALWRLKDVDFEQDLEVDAVAIFEEKSALIVGGFFTGDRKGYLAVVNSTTPGGHVLHRFDGPVKIEQLGLQQAPKIVPGAETRIRFQIRSGAIRLYVGDQEALGATDAQHAKGWLLLGTAGGTMRLKKLTVQGKVNPVEIDKRFAEVEVLVRRALESDLGKKKPEDTTIDPLSAEDEYLLERLDSGVRADFEKKRAAFVQAHLKRRLLPPHGAMFDDIVRKAPEFAAGHYWRAIALMSTNRTEEAKDDLAAAVRLCPDFHEAHLAISHVGLDERDFAGAAAAIRKSLELSPGFGDAVAMGAFLKFLSGDSKSAVADLELARKLDPSSDSIATTQKNVLNVLKGPQHLGAKWVKEFPHYIVMTDISMEKTALYGSRLEAAYKFYSETFKDVFTEEPKRPKPRVAIFNTREAYMTYGELTLSNRQEWTLGYFHPLYRELLLFEDVDVEATLQTLYHEAFHQFMSLMIARVPFWYNEGIAEYMGGIKVEVAKGQSKIVERARILDGRLKGLKMALNFALKFEDIMMQTPGQFYSGPVSFKYAQAWSMVHFFYEGSGGKYRPKIDAYFKKLKEGGSPREAFQAGFGDASMDDLQKEWLEYVKKMEPVKK